MDETYDVCVLGTGFKECVLSGLLSVDKKKVLQLDRNNYYGGESASLNLEQFYARFAPGKEVPKALGNPRHWNIDTCPKFIMGSGLLVRMLLYTQVHRYLEFQLVPGSYVLKDGKIHKVPSSAAEAVSSSLVGFFEKRRLKDFLSYATAYEQEKKETHKSGPGKDLATFRCADLFAYYKLAQETADFLGHAMALHLDDSYLDRPALETIERINLYVDSTLRYPNSHSPYIYTMYGLGELPQAYARLSAIYGGTFMLDKPVDEIVYGADGRVCGVRSGAETAKCSAVFCDPTYAPTKCKKVGQVVRCYAFMSHPVPNTQDAPAVQIIIPARQVKRKSDIYVCVLSAQHQVVPKGKFLALCSTIVETGDPNKELDAAIAVLGAPIDERFYHVDDIFEPTNDPAKDGVYISTSYDATTNFETSSRDILALYERYTGKPLDLSAKNPALLQEEAQ